MLDVEIPDISDDDHSAPSTSDPQPSRPKRSKVTQKKEKKISFLPMRTFLLKCCDSVLKQYSAGYRAMLSKPIEHSVDHKMFSFAPGTSTAKSTSENARQRKNCITCLKSVPKKLKYSTNCCPFCKGEPAFCSQAHFDEYHDALSNAE